MTTIGYICENIDPTILAPQSNQILTAVAQGAQKSEENLGVRVAAVRALYNSLEFVRDNFEVCLVSFYLGDSEINAERAVPRHRMNISNTN